MNGKHTIFVTRRQTGEDLHDVSLSQERLDAAIHSSSFLADRGETEQPSPSINRTSTGDGH